MDKKKYKVRDETKPMLNIQNHDKQQAQAAPYTTPDFPKSCSVVSWARATLTSPLTVRGAATRRELQSDWTPLGLESSDWICKLCRLQCATVKRSYKRKLTWLKFSWEVENWKAMYPKQVVCSGALRKLAYTVNTCTISDSWLIINTGLPPKHSVVLVTDKYVHKCSLLY